ncbi:MAG: hypothetical protein V2I33_24210 [Kangiellaceae bacterium]|jgi:hypothetical protein|nr:hypothetical protein [Kangiellaceae bacterium]
MIAIQSVIEHFGWSSVGLAVSPNFLGFKTLDFLRDPSSEIFVRDFMYLNDSKDSVENGVGKILKSSGARVFVGIGEQDQL